MDVIVRYGLWLLLFAMLSLSCGAASGWFCATASAGFAKNLRHDLYYRVQDFSFSNIDRFSTSSLVTRLTTDVTNVQNAFMFRAGCFCRAARKQRQHQKTDRQFFHRGSLPSD